MSGILCLWQHLQYHCFPNSCQQMQNVILQTCGACPAERVSFKEGLHWLISDTSRFPIGRTFVSMLEYDNMSISLFSCIFYQFVALNIYNILSTGTQGLSIAYNLCRRHQSYPSIIYQRWSQCWQDLCRCERSHDFEVGSSGLTIKLLGSLFIQWNL
jgi:hypothetical protein